MGYLGRDYVLPSTDRAVSTFAVLYDVGAGLKMISCIADVTLGITAAKEYWFFHLAAELKN